MNRRTVVRALIALVLAGAGVMAAPRTGAAQASEDASLSVVYLVRHAEKATDDPRDPNLNEAGLARAAELARVLADAPLTRIFSTDYRRTQQTAAPVAEHHGLEVESYDPSGDGLAAFAGVLRDTPGHHLVVGHSNTTPFLVQALGGDPVSAIEEAGEYDRLYVVMISDEVTVTSTLIRFGERWVPAEAPGGTPGAP